MGKDEENEDKIDFFLFVIELMEKSKYMECICV